MLAPGGFVMIYTPNVEYFDSMNPYHPYIYSPDTLKRLLLQVGLEPFHLDASPPPRGRGLAVRLLNPQYEVACAARAGEPHDLPYPELDPVRLAQSHAWGHKCRAWSELGLRDLGVRIAERAWLRLPGLAGRR